MGRPPCGCQSRRDESSIWSRQGKNLSRYFPDLVEAAAEQMSPGCLLDGGAVFWAGERLDFSALQRRLSTSMQALPGLFRRVPVHFVAFDLLAVTGHDIRRAIVTGLAVDGKLRLVGRSTD